MAKTNLQRLNSSLETLLTLGGSNQAIYKAYFGILEWLEAQQNIDQAKETLGAKLTLGNYMIHSANAKAHRNAVRALMLLLATRYNHNDIQLKKIADDHKSYSNATSTKDVINIIVQKSAGIIVAHGGVVIMPGVYEAAKQKGLAYEATSRNIRKSRDEAKRIIQAGLANIAKKDPNGNIRDWFGDLSNEQTTLLKENLTKLLTALNSKSIQFKVSVKGNVWGTAIPQSFDSMMKQQYIQVDLGNYYFTQSGDHSKQTRHDPTFYDRVLGDHLALKSEQQAASKKFFNDIKGKSEEQIENIDREFTRAGNELTQKIRKNASLLPEDDDQIISYAGVVLHEATHNVLDTEDVEIVGQAMYGPNSCFWLASRMPQRALNNADNYRLYCECFL